MVNAEQVSFKSYGGTAPENYEKYFVPVIGGPLATELVEIAAIHSGERVLDVACGTGIVARLASERIGPNGKVAGVDMNAGMLTVARSQAAGKRIEWYEANAEKIPLENDSFDVVLCQLGLQFVQDRLAALREMWRVLAPNGRLLIRTAGPTPEVFEIFDEALARHIGAQAGAFVQKVFSLHSKSELQQLLTDAGFREISVRSEIKSASLPAPDKFLWEYIASTPLTQPVAQASEEKRTALQNEVLSKWEKFTENGRLILKIPDVLTTARK